MTPTPPADAALNAFFEAVQRHRPVDATFMGDHLHDHRLPDLSETGLGDFEADARALLERLGPHRASLDPLLASGFLEIVRWELGSGHVVRSNPSYYTGEAIFGLLSLFLTRFAPVAERVEAARARLDAVPTLLARLRDNVRAAPASWTRRAMAECDGALALLGDPGSLALLAAEEGFDPALLEVPAARAAAAFAELRRWLETELLARNGTGVACGEEGVELHLRRAHFLHDSADELVRYARSALAEARADLEARAAEFGAATPREALAGLERLHPPTDGYLARYDETLAAVRHLVEEHDLLTWPDFPLRFVPRPRWVRRAAPHLYFLFYRSPAARGRPPVHEYLVAPLDEAATEEERLGVLRSHNDSVIKLNHVVHHGGPGHHVQNWHAFRAQSRVGRVAAVDCASRIAMGCGGTMAEGWACYATDLIAEFGGLTPLEAYAERHTRVRMACRAVVDLELHRERMSEEEAVAFYQREAGMTEGAARGETTRNGMFPGSALMYLFGTDAFHDLRRRVAARDGASFHLGRFHDAFLSHGSVPVSLVARSMLAQPAPGGPDAL